MPGIKDTLSDEVGKNWNKKTLIKCLPYPEHCLRCWWEETNQKHTAAADKQGSIVRLAHSINSGEFWNYFLLTVKDRWNNRIGKSTRNIILPHSISFQGHSCPTWSGSVSENMANQPKCASVRHLSHCPFLLHFLVRRMVVEGLPSSVFLQSLRHQIRYFQVLSTKSLSTKL